MDNTWPLSSPLCAQTSASCQACTCWWAGTWRQGPRGCGGGRHSLSARAARTWQPSRSRCWAWVPCASCCGCWTATPAIQCALRPSSPSPVSVLGSARKGHGPQGQELVLEVGLQGSAWGQRERDLICSSLPCTYLSVSCAGDRVVSLPTPCQSGPCPNNTGTS